MAIGHFRKKPVEIQALQLRWDNWDEMCAFAEVGKLEEGKPEGYILPGSGTRMGMQIPTLEGTMFAEEGDWIIRGVEGELYPCKPSVFEKTYEAVRN